MLPVTIIHAGVERTVHVAAGERLADACLESGALPLGCRKGGCGTCLVRIVEGDSGTRTDRELAFLRRAGRAEPDLRLGCQLVPDRPLVVITVGKDTP